jgi:hypothetical protein
VIRLIHGWADQCENVISVQAVRERINGITGF